MNYGTNFWLSENPISEGLKWTNGATDGLDWSDCRTTPAFAFGTQPGNLPPPQKYADSTALVKGAWGTDQFAQATVLNNDAQGSWFAEVELRLRSKISAHSNIGYEFNISCNATGGNYCAIVRWNGALADFTQLDLQFPGIVHTGDIISATAIGSVLTFFKNGSQIAQATDNTFTTGNPGVGFYLENNGASGDPTKYGLSAFFARDTNIPIAARTRIGAMTF